MNHEQCPVCFEELEVRAVNPCFVCGGLPDVAPSKPDWHFKIREDGTPLTLCEICFLEEVLSNQGDLKERIRIKDQRDLVEVSPGSTPKFDKFCPTCNQRLSLLNIMAHRLSDEELERWRKWLQR
jgi:hypothetical protein